MYKLVKTDKKGSILEDHVDYAKTAQEPWRIFIFTGEN